MSITRAQQSDWLELEALYRRNHPATSCDLSPDTDGVQVFVEKDNSNGDRIRGFAIASYAEIEGRRYGVIRVLEIEQDLRNWDLVEPFMVRELIEECATWLAAQGCTSADVTILAQSEHAWVLPQLRAETHPSGIIIPVEPRQPEWQLVLDGKTGLIYSVAGPEGAPPGPPPGPFQAAPRVWN